VSSSQHLVTRILASSVAIADRAGQIVRDVWARGQLGIEEKTGKDDLQTEADRSAQNCIVASLARQFPGLAIVGEEGDQDLSSVPHSWIVETQDSQAASLVCPERFHGLGLGDLTVWVDPLDGTKEYTQGLLDHVTVLIGIAVGMKPWEVSYINPTITISVRRREPTLGGHSMVWWEQESEDWTHTHLQ